MNTLKTKGALAIAIILWASAFVGIRVGLTEYSPGALALLRFIIASGCMGLLYSRLPPQPLLSFKHKLELCLIGVAGIGVYNICLNYGEINVSAGIASFIIGLMPVISVLLSVFFLKERPTLGVWFGIFISFLGLFFMMESESSAPAMTTSVLVILIATITGSIYNVAQKSYLKHHHPITITAWILWGGTVSMLMFLPDLWYEFPQVHLSTTCAVLYLGVFPAAIAYVAWCYALEHMSVTKASLYLYAMPILSTLLGFLYLHETPSLLTLTGGLIALLGALIAHHFDKPETIDKLSKAV